MTSWKQTFSLDCMLSQNRDNSMIGILINVIGREGNLSKARDVMALILVWRVDGWDFVV